MNDASIRRGDEVTADCNTEHECRVLEGDGWSFWEQVDDVV